MIRPRRSSCSTTDAEALLAYDRRQMILEHGDRCWYCGRRCGDWQSDKPAWWHGPWTLHRAHVASHPRRADRRAVVLLCPICHGLTHGDRYPQLPDAVAPTLAELLWLKRTRDPGWYDRAWLQRHSTRLLPRAKKPKAAKLGWLNG